MDESRTTELQHGDKARLERIQKRKKELAVQSNPADASREYDGYSYYKKYRLATLPYKGSLKDREEWKQDLQFCFLVFKKHFSSDKQKIELALENMDVTGRKRWDRHLRNHHAEEQEELWNNWESFLRWSQALMEDSLITIHLKYEDAQQLPEQSPKQFNYYLEMLEGNRSKSLDEARALNLFAKIEPWLQGDIKRYYPEFPNNRKDMVEAAQRLWEIQRHETMKRRHDDD